MEKEVNSEERKTSYFEKARGNPWIVSTVVLAVLAVVLVFYLSSGRISGNAVSGEQAGENLVSFVNSQGQGTASFVSAEKEGTLYKVTVTYEGEDIPVYVTLDGKYLVTTPVPLTSESDTITDNSDTTATTDNTNTQTATSVPKSDKPVVDLFVMSYCPYGTQAEKGIIPAVEALGDKIDFNMRFVYYAMHGETEIDENTKQYCIQKEQSSKFLAYMKCFLDKSDSASCLTSTGIDKTKLDSCVSAADNEFNITALFEDESSWLSGRYPKYNVDAADNNKYGIQGSPTLVINGKQASSGRDSASYLKAICAAFNEAPSECETQLSSAQPSAGFGYTDSTTGSATAAQCG